MFAPTDSAFAALDRATLEAGCLQGSTCLTGEAVGGARKALRQSENRDLLQRVLRYHAAWLHMHCKHVDPFDTAGVSWPDLTGFLEFLSQATPGSRLSAAGRTALC